MLGYLGLTIDVGRRLVTGADPQATRLTFVDDGCAVLLDTFRSDLAVDDRYVLAFEGYLLDLEPVAARSPARWLLPEYAARGLAAFDRLNGAYTICLFDRLQRRAWLTACPFARRELYYVVESSGVAFATDLEPLQTIMNTPPVLDTDQIASSFLCGALHGTDTLLKGVRRALPGSVIHVSAGRVTEQPPAPLTPAIDGRFGAREVEDELDWRLRRAIARIAPMSERQVVFMSAGVDSSLVAAYVKTITGHLDAFTLRTPPDETSRARAICDALGGMHYVIGNPLDEIDVVPELDRFVRVMDEPVFVGVGLSMMTLARRARDMADGFVCGLGGDTLFGEWEPELGDGRQNSIYHYAKAVIDPDLMRDLVELTGPHPDTILPRLRAQLSPEDVGLRFRMMFELRLAVRLAARVARAHGAEALSPFLDCDVVEAALCLPSELLTVDKPLLRALGTRYFSDTLQQPWKVGFSATPIELLLANGRLGPLLDLLDEPRTRWRGVYRTSGLRQLIDLYRTGRTVANRRWHAVLWQVAVFELFCRRFVDRIVEPVAAAS